MADTNDNLSSLLNLATPVHRFALTQPDAAALVLDGCRHSYAELADSAARVAAWLRRRAFTTADAPRVGVLASRSFETYAGMLGAAWAGATYVPLNPKQPPARLASILGCAGLSALVADAKGAVQLGDEAVRALLPPAVLTGDAVTSPAADATRWSGLPEADANSAPAMVAPGHPAYVMFTSGTTGVPKGVVVSVASVTHFLAAVRSLYGIGPGDRAGQFAEPSFDLSVFEIFAAWDGGASLHVVPESQMPAPARFIRREQLTIWTSVPSVISILARLKLLEPGVFPTLRVSFFIGEALPVESARAWRRAAPNSVVDNHYGPTEATVACTMQRIGDPVRETPGRGTVAIGQPYEGMLAGIVTRDGRFLPAGEEGELALCGPQLAQGYLGDPEQTAQRFVTLDHPDAGRSRWYLTGDLAVRDGDGTLHCLGRIDHQVKVMGHRVELEDVEAHVRAASGTDEVAAVAWPIEGGSATGLVAFVCGASADTTGIRERLKELVPPYMVPRRILAIEALPLTANGKVDRAALRARLDAKS